MKNWSLIYYLTKKIPKKPNWKRRRIKTNNWNYYLKNLIDLRMSYYFLNSNYLK